MTTELMIILGLLVLAIATLGYFVFRANARIERLLQGSDAKSLEDSFAWITDEIKRMNANELVTEKALNNLNMRLKKSISGFKTVRFNPFPESGGNQSFAIALVNEEGNGVIISSLYSRERTSVFAKPVKGGTSEFELTAEEKQALTDAS